MKNKGSEHAVGYGLENIRLGMQLKHSVRKGPDRTAAAGQLQAPSSQEPLVGRC